MSKNIVGLRTRLAGHRVRRKDQKKHERRGHQAHTPSHVDPGEYHAKIMFLPFPFARRRGGLLVSDVGAFIEQLIRNVCVVCALIFLETVLRYLKPGFNRVVFSRFE